MTILLYIRLRQLKREIDGLGLYVFVFIVLACYLVFESYQQFEQGKNSIYWVLGLVITCMALQVYRKDKSFAYKHLSNPHVQIFLEYLALTFPFSISCIITKSWYCYPLLVMLLWGIPFFKLQIKYRTVFKNISSVIPAQNFEWISGIRKQYVSLISLYVLALSFCWLKILPLFLLWLLTILIISFHSECEPIQVLRAGNKTPGKYLAHKLFLNIIYMIILYSPVLILNTLFNIDLLVVNSLFILMQISLLCFAICMKYSSYKPNKNQMGNNIPLAIVSMGAALPHFLPVPTLLSFAYFYKAKNNLKLYLND